MAKKKALKRGGKPRKKAQHLARVETVRHKDKRKNIPTEELRDFVADEEQQPQKVLYPRDPSLDPQLVWKGKDEQDSRPLEVPAVPIYIQDKVHPQAIVEDFRANAPKRRKADEVQLDFWADFNGLPEEFDQRVDFYHHEGNWSNRLILGDSLFVMTSLAEKEGLKGKVQMIYIDPPYGIKFGSNWQVSTRKRDVKDGKAQDATRQPEQVQAFRDTWKRGIHSYLAYLRDRLVVARELLTESGSVFIQIGDENVHLVRILMDEVFGPDNLVSLISFRKTSAVSSPMARVNVLGGVCDLLVWYAKNRETVKYRQLYLTKSVETDIAGVYSWLELPSGVRRRMTAVERQGQTVTSVGARVFRVDNVTSAGWSERLSVSIPMSGSVYETGKDRHWATHPEGMRRLGFAGRLVPAGKSLGYVRYIDDFAVYPLVNNWTDTGTGSFTDDKVYVVQTGTKVVERCVLMTTDPGDVLLDATCGSGTTACVAEQWGRRWITIDTSRVALTLARTRLMAARFPYYLLADTPEGMRKEAEIVGRFPPSPMPKAEEDIRKGFVYKRVPHVTLKSIANNEEIDTIHARWQEQLEPLRSKLNKALGKKWEEWEIPREPEKDWPKEAKTLLGDWWDRRRQRQHQIDDSIARRADVELLYDQPYEDPKRVRVTGPFTVESLSPHRTISVEQKKRRTFDLKERTWHPKMVGPDHFGTMILDHLRTAGVQNTYKKERLKFDTLDPFAGEWIHGAGTFTDSDKKARRVAVCIGPEHGTVGPQLVKEAAKEAVQGVGYDVLVICGFAFDPHVSEEVKRYGKLVVLPARMNPDLAMGELLKKTGAANLFMVFGEPDLKVTRQKDGRIVVEIKGLDVYDPTTGEIRSSSTDDIACWFIDTNYNEESFFVRHAYFTGADQPYEKLKRALRAEIDEAAWGALYSTTSRPFDPPETGKIAVKVINHYGDEVLKVYEVK